MAALIRQANSRYEMANKPKLEKKECMVEEKEKNKHSEKKEEAEDGGEKRDKGWIHVIRVRLCCLMSSDVG